MMRTAASIFLATALLAGCFASTDDDDTDGRASCRIDCDDEVTDCKADCDGDACLLACDTDHDTCVGDCN